MASKVELCNFALQELGASYITSLTEDTKNARECNLRFDSARRALLRMSLWNFAIKRVLLNRETSTPAFNYKYQFALPSDFLKVVMTDQEESYQSYVPFALDPTIAYSNVPDNSIGDKYRIEGKKFISNDETVNIVYVADIEDTGEWDSLFTELFVKYLKAKIARKVTGSKGDANEAMQEFNTELKAARSIDSQEGVFDKIQYSSFLSVRF